MMKKITLFCILLIILCSCRSTYNYGLGNHTSESTPLQKPTYRGDSIRKAIYLSGAINNSFLNENLQEYNNRFHGVVEAHRAITKKSFNFAYGAFAYLGNYDASNFLGVQGGDLSFYGIGATTEFNLNVPAEHFDWRIIGVKMTLLTEDGKYNSFKDDLKVAVDESGINDRSFFNVDKVNIEDNTSFTVVFTSEIVYKNDNFDLGYSFALGGGQFFSYGNRLFFSKDKLTYSIKTNSSLQGNYAGFGISYQLK